MSYKALLFCVGLLASCGGPLPVQDGGPEPSQDEAEEKTQPAPKPATGGVKATASPLRVEKQTVKPLAATSLLVPGNNVQRSTSGTEPTYY